MSIKENSMLLNISNVSVLFLIMFIDGVGMSLVLPLIGELFSNNVNSMIPLNTPHWIYLLYYAGSLACYSGAMIIGAVLLGQLSDTIGRKNTLYLSLIGAVIGYLVCSLAVIIKWPLLLLFGRVVDGLTAGSIPVAQAMLSDIDSRQNKMTSIGLVMFAVTSGYMLGPVIASVAFANEQYHLLYLPFLLVAALCTICISLLGLINESKQIKNDNGIQFDLTVAFRQIKALLEERDLRPGLFGFFLFQSAWTLFYQYLPQMQLSTQNLSSSKTTLLLTEVGIGMCVAFCIIVPKAQKYFLPKQWVLGCVTLFTFFSFSFLNLHINWIQFQLTSICMSILYAVGYSAMLAYLLSIANENQKGLILGSVASICAISATITALLGSMLTGVSYSFFFQGIALASCIALLLFVKSTRSLVSAA